MNPAGLEKEDDCAGETSSNYKIQIRALLTDGAPHKETRHYVRFEVFTAVTMKNGVFRDVMPCGSFENRRFGGT
jgi:recombination DNA repair RAD52 pathway protein